MPGTTVNANFSFQGKLTATIALIPNLSKIRPCYVQKLEASPRTRGVRPGKIASKIFLNLPAPGIILPAR
jgi:hypothetical protein